MKFISKMTLSATQIKRKDTFLSTHMKHTHTVEKIEDDNQL